MKHLRKQIASYLLTLILIMAGIVFPGSGEKVLASGGSMTVHFLDVGQGLSILVQSEGQNLLYDGGPRSASSYVVSYLQEQNVSEIDYLISSHYDEDHVSGLIGCLNAFQVDNVIGADYIHDSSLYGSFMDAVSAHGLEVQHPAVGAEYTFGSGEFTILSPKEISKESNANSVAIKLTNGENSFVFTGDADFNCEADMVNSGLDLSCDVLSVGHHGSATSTSWDFLQAAVPEFAVISCGAGNMYGHPHADTMEKLSDMGIQVYRSDEQGTIVASSDGSAITWSADPCNDYTSGDGETAGQSEGENGFTAEDNSGTDAAAASEKSEQIAAADDSQEEMLGLINTDVRMTKRLSMQFGYVTMKALYDTAFFKKDTKIRVHEFHYSKADKRGDACEITKYSGKCWNGLYVKDKIMAGYPHFYFHNCREVAKRFVDMAEEASTKRC